jgi:hypothetical protein
MAGDNITNTDDPRKTHPFRGERKNLLVLGDPKSKEATPDFRTGTKNDVNFELKDYNFQGNPNDIASIPKIKVSEFQSNYIFNWQTKLNDLVNAAFATLDVVGDGANRLASFLPEGAAEKIPDFKKKVDAIYKEVLGSRSNSDPILGRPIEMVKEMFTGKFVASYDLPYFGDAYLTANSTADWSNSDGSGLAGVVKDILRKGTNIDYPLTPSWSPSSPNDAPPIETEIILYNDSFDNLNRNFRFLHSLAAGAFWIQDNYKQRQPNIYDVHFPGYFQYYYCSLDLEITTLGMKRTLTSGSFKKLTSDNGIRLPQGTFFPDAYKLTIKFQPLVPNNFNMYLKYILLGPEDDVNVGSERKNVTQVVGERIKSLLADGITGKTVGDTESNE